MARRKRQRRSRRQGVRARAATLVVSGLCGVAALAATLVLYLHLNRERLFWEWFTGFEAAAFEYERDRERVNGEIGRQLRKVDRSLVFVIGPIRDGRRDFIISADGRTEAFPAVMSLHDKAPAFTRWTIVAFRPRASGVFDVVHDGQSVRSDEIRFVSRAQGTRHDVDLFVPEQWLGDSEAAHEAAVFALGSVLGEHDLATRIGRIELRPAAEGAAARPLAELPSLLDEMRSARLAQ